MWRSRWTRKGLRQLRSDWRARRGASWIARVNPAGLLFIGGSSSLRWQVLAAAESLEFGPSQGSSRIFSLAQALHDAPTRTSAIGRRSCGFVGVSLLRPVRGRGLRGRAEAAGPAGAVQLRRPEESGEDAGGQRVCRPARHAAAPHPPQPQPAPIPFSHAFLRCLPAGCAVRRGSSDRPLSVR